VHEADVVLLIASIEAFLAIGENRYGRRRDEEGILRGFS
jgi:hypothetical protein